MTALSVMDFALSRGKFFALGGKDAAGILALAEVFA
jgi:hypothetical protein